MAFRQPTFAPTSRPTTANEPANNEAAVAPLLLHRDPQESQEWVLFPACSTTPTQTAVTECTPRTAGLSRLSDFGSLAARSRQGQGIIGDATDGSAVEDEELDSLDEGLHAFQEPSLFQRPGYLDHSGSILPRHDGLGTFPAASPPVQEQLWHFEHYNPRKRSLSGHHQRRRSSVQRRLDALEDHDAANIEGERRERIEKWRMEHSRILLAEIEKETRRRRTSLTSRRAERIPSSASLEQAIKESVHTQLDDQETERSRKPEQEKPPDNESLWERITRRVIRDFIGIDDTMLSIILGESLPDERSSAVNPSSGADSQKSIRLDNANTTASVSSWEGRLLDRIARELGVLVQHLSEHPGALSTPQSPPDPDYAGIPVTVPTSSKTQPKPSSLNTRPEVSPTSFCFNPTLPDGALATPISTADSNHAALWGIEEEPATDPQQEERDYWEQPPDLKTVLRFLHNRFTTQRRPSNTVKPPLNIATTSTPDSLRRAAVIRQYHPVVSRAVATWEHRHRHTRRLSLLRGRNGSSCASSIIGSARRPSGIRGGSLGSSSGNYWDLGGSAVGSGAASAIVGVGGLGAWGEV